MAKFFRMFNVKEVTRLPFFRSHPCLDGFISPTATGRKVSLISEASVLLSVVILLVRTRRSEQGSQ